MGLDSFVLEISIGDQACRFDEDGLLKVEPDPVLLAPSDALDFPYEGIGCLYKSGLELRRRLSDFSYKSMGDHVC